MIVAGGVLPRPGGRYRRTWSAASSLALAAWSSTPRLALTSRWPMYSSSERGRREPSMATSAGASASAASRRGGEAPPRGVSGLGERVAEGLERTHDVPVAGHAGHDRAGCRDPRGGDLLLEL